jgi:hypothetical protein
MISGMAKAKILKMTILLFGILFIGGVAYGQINRQGSAEFEPGSEPNGFRDIKWGTDISTLKDMTLVMSIDNDVKRYQRKNDVLKIDGAKLDYIHYEFWKGIFYLVDIGFQGVENSDNLRKAMLAKFGKGQRMSGEGETLLESYRWEGEKTTVIMIYDSKTGGGGLTISSTEITDQKAREEKE